MYILLHGEIAYKNIVHATINEMQTTENRKITAFRRPNDTSRNANNLNGFLVSVLWV